VSRPEPNGARRRSRTQRGTTLIETIVATTILAILSTTALGGVLFGISQTRVTFNRASAAAWVEAEFDFLRLKGYSGLSVGTRTLTQTTGYTTLGSISEPTIPQFFDHAVVAVVCAPPVGNCATLPAYQVTVTLYTGPSTSFAVLSTYISQYTHV
jgi:prepilin-type N-terminal cleavage/methylation domain-containing protein